MVTGPVGGLIVVLLGLLLGSWHFFMKMVMSQCRGQSDQSSLKKSIRTLGQKQNGGKQSTSIRLADVGSSASLINRPTAVPGYVS